MEAEELPPGIAAAWGVRAAATKGPKPRLALEQILTAGMAVADEEGLAAVSMGTVARRLGASPMSLYRYVESKDELLALMTDAAMGAAPTPPAHADWRRALSTWAWSLVRAMRAHPWTTHVPIAGPPVAPNAVAWFEAALRPLGDTALTEAEKASVVMMLSGYVRNHVTLMAEVHAHFLERAGDPDAAMRGYGDLLRGLTERDRFPALHALLDSGTFDRADPPDDEFAFGLSRILDGVEALVASRAQVSAG